ncbi:MAG TPA: class I SAM-dependent methyltransferase [Limnobacter sp.]|nr:class I SAM-dependent methyltransferase [Limnobacter sp.]
MQSSDTLFCKLANFKVDVDALREHFRSKVEPTPFIEYRDNQVDYVGWAVTSRDGSTEDGVKRIGAKTNNNKRGTTKTGICTGVLGEVIDQLMASGLDPYRCRLMKLSSEGTAMPFHTDSDTETWRLHIPVITNEDCHFQWQMDDGTIHSVHLPADGSAWLVRVDVEHRAINARQQTSERVHLLMGCGNPPSPEQITAPFIRLNSEVPKAVPLPIATTGHAAAPKPPSPQAKPASTQKHLLGWARLREFTDRVGPYMGSDLRSMFLYNLVRLHRPRTVMELGTGFGVSALWIARGLQENGEGHLHVVDRGFSFTAEHKKMFRPDELKDNFAAYMDHLFRTHELHEQMSFHQQSFPPFPNPAGKYDMVYSDFKHGPSDLLEILAFYLPKMNTVSNFFIDSAPSLFGSYMFLTQLMEHFKNGRVPELLRQRIAPQEQATFMEFIHTHDIQMVPVTENIDRSQNAFAWLRIQPTDVMPRPLHRYRLDDKHYMSSKRINAGPEEPEKPAQG